MPNAQPTDNPESVPLPPEQLNHNAFVGALNVMFPFLATNSPSRLSMDAAHLAQAVVLNTPSPMLVSSGADREYANTVFDIRLDGTPNGLVRILKILRKYVKMGLDSSIKNTETYVIYEDLDTRTIDVAVVPTFRLEHIYFGFKYVFTDAFLNLNENSLVPANTILATSPQVDLEQNNYMPGREVMAAMGSFNEVTEDGIGISESLAKQMSTMRIGTASFNFGENNFPLNIYGDNEEYKVFPDIGEYIRPDGLLFATRQLDEDLSPVMMTKRAVQEIDHNYDNCHYAIPNAKVLDITIYRSHNPSTCHIPTGMGDQCYKYFHNRTDFEEKLERYYFHLEKEHGNRITFSERLHRLIVKTMGLSHNRLKGSNRVVYRREPLQEYRVTITYGIEEPIQIGHKLSCLSAGKGVVTAIIPDHLMPIAEDGTRADILLDDNSTIHRMNTGRLWSSELAKHILTQRGKLRRLLAQTKDVEMVFNELLHFYRVASPWYYHVISKGITDKASKEHHLHEFIEGKISIVIPHGTCDVGSCHSKRLHEHFPLHYGKVTLFDIDGHPVQSKDDFLLAPLYMIRLEKIGADWSATTIPYRQQHGVIAKLSMHTKHKLPYRNQAVRILGETEVRLLYASINPVVVAALLRAASNPTLCNDVVYNLLNAENPTLLPQAIDYENLSRYPSRVVEAIDHLNMVMGLKLEYQNEEERRYDIIEPLAVGIAEEAYEEIGE